ncbi:MAG: hypothetical protein J6K15_15775 [Lachnospiraceae bacterium]|nr:hypothetical protein [Lachnospiraceae bacterium]
MSENSSAEKQIGKPDGPTAYFLIGGKNHKPTLKQRFQKWRFNKKKVRVAKKVKANPHTLDEVCEYIKTSLGFEELSQESKVYQHEYKELRAGFLMQYAPELLGEHWKRPQLAGESEEEIREFMDAVETQKQVAFQVPKEDFDIEFRMFKKKLGDGEQHILIEKRYGYIGGGASGKAKTVKQFKKVFRAVHCYYGVTKGDIENKTRRYEDYLKQLAR